MPFCFAITLFLSATLLFLVQPMLAKMILPLLGGAPAVWNTCMVFFQATLLAGYGYAHFIRTHLSIRRQILLHVLVLSLPLLVLPIRVDSWAPPEANDPVGWLLGMLVVCAGLPFFAVATSAPLLQDWFAKVRHRTSEDPYYLYAASNAGSLTALLLYPLLLEPHLRLAQQSGIWMVGYGVLLALVIGCAFLVWKAGDSVKDSPVIHLGERLSTAAGAASQPSSANSKSPATLTRLRWIALAFVPSSLLLGVTTFITTDIAPIPLLWIIPLAMYLLSFILVFSRLAPLLHVVMVPLLPVLILVLLALPVLGIQLEMTEAIAVQLAAFFVATMVCHGELARARPPTSHLTEYYLWMALGGFLGGAFNTLLAPIIFSRVIEYPLAIVLACLLRPHWGVGSVLQSFQPSKRTTGGQASPNAPRKGRPRGRSSARNKAIKQLDKPKPAPTPSASLLTLWGARLGTLTWCGFGLGAGVLFFLTSYGADPGTVRVSERNFFGVVQVRDNANSPFIEFYHGTTLHGLQSHDANERRFARSYFHKDGPIGQVFEAFNGPDAKKKIGVIGLGIGSLAAYVDRGQGITFYEIDPAVARIARDTTYFSFLSECEARGGRLNVVLGDGRLQLERSPETFDLLVIDAFSSDSIPVHLLTKQAIRLYLDHLEDDGILAFNISSKYLRLAAVLGDVAAELGLVSLVQVDTGTGQGPNSAEMSEAREAYEQFQKTKRVDPRLIMKALKAEEARMEESRTTGRSPSQWVIMARRTEQLGKLAKDPRWRPIIRTPGSRVWSDDYSNLLSVFVWSEQAEVTSQLENLTKKP
jgi:hypothetical protein